MTDNDTVSCLHCGMETRMKGTQLCDACYEFSRRLVGYVEMCLNARHLSEVASIVSNRVADLCRKLPFEAKP